jgi:flagellar basal-body rod modification protein FlgD
MPVASATASQSIASLTANPAQATPRVAKRTLGQEDFLKLITVQLSSQDPMKPMEDTAFIAQMAQFSSLEQSTQLAREFAALRSLNELNTAGAMLGRQVTVTTEGGEPVTGVVQAIDRSGASPRLLIDGKLYPASAVTRVEVPPAPGPLPAA